ncbi:MAG TPA: response regulator [Candidatus Binatia bacterium]|jgi:DNA-binding NtrC family response regulator|nr:response regulator [Candidatus Binatia bacterium]
MKPHLLSQHQGFREGTNVTGAPQKKTGGHMSLNSKRHVDQDHSSLKGIRVLVVEDTWQVAKALKSALEQVGMDVSGPAATTAEARRLIAQHMPCVAVVDVNLKREMACSLIEELHDQGVSVVVVSGYAVPPVSADKAAAILQKPFSATELLTALHDAVARNQIH